MRKTLLAVLFLALGSASADESTLSADGITKGYQNPWTFGVKWKDGGAYDSAGATIAVTVLKGDGTSLFTKTATPAACPPAMNDPHKWDGYACFQTDLTAIDTGTSGTYKIRADTVKGAGHDPAVGTLVIKG